MMIIALLGANKSWCFSKVQLDTSGVAKLHYCFLLQNHTQAEQPIIIIAPVEKLDFKMLHTDTHSLQSVNCHVVLAAAWSQRCGLKNPPCICAHLINEE